MFAIAAWLLKESGSYLCVAESSAWLQGINRVDWAHEVDRVGSQWRHWCIEQLESKASTPFPPEVSPLWATVVSRASMEIADIRNTDPVWVALVKLVAYADEACAGCGVPSMRGATDDAFRKKDAFERHVQEGFVTQVIDGQPATMCKRVHASKASVLPKLHTPLNGVTIRSMSHNLALVQGNAVQVHWLESPKYEGPGIVDRIGDSINLLLMPWPFKVCCGDFQPARVDLISRLPNGHRFFGFTPQAGAEDLVWRASKLLKAAQKQYGRIDGLVLPELAVSPEDYDALRGSVFDQVEMLICGVAEPPSADGHGSNYAQICVALDDRYYEVKQHKHHRWYLEDSQIRRYGLSPVLDPGKYWWESTKMNPRELWFMALKPWLTLNVLICEDLARPDPVGDVVRAVGPNLVVALLMDGPQIAGRWSERCAAVLADDPGCSVLTLTSIGMASVSRPPSGKAPSRIVALWKDRDGIQEIALPEGHDGIVLSLSNRFLEEWTADGRGDGCRSATIKLSGIYPISSPPPP